VANRSLKGKKFKSLKRGEQREKGETGKGYKKGVLKKKRDQGLREKSGSCGLQTKFEGRGRRRGGMKRKEKKEIF